MWETCDYEVPGIILLRNLKRATRLDLVETCLCMFQLVRVTISTHSRQLCVSCGDGKSCVFLRLVAKMSDRSLEQRMDTKLCVKLGKSSLENKRGAFRMILKADDEVCNGNIWHPHDPRQLACRNQKWRQCSSLSSISRVLITLNSFYKANSQPSILCGNTEAVTWNSA
jgi:hypothetical protein